MRSYFHCSIVLFALAASGCGTPTSSPLATPDASATSPYLLGDAIDASLPVPGLEEAAAGDVDRAAVEAAASGAVRNRSGDVAANPCVRWNELTRTLAAGAALPPPLFARAYALVSVACHDGIVAAGRGNRAATPVGCVVGAAVSEVLLDLFPSRSDVIADALAVEAAIAAGEDRGTVMRGLALGRAAGRVAVRHAHRDGADTPFTGTIPTGDGIWTGTNPVLPACGSWQTWLVTSGSEFPSEPPYAFGSAEDLAEVQAVVDAAAARTPEQVAIVHKWADRSPPAIWNEMLNQEIVARGLGPEETSLAHAYLNMALADAFVTCWATKYLYWTARPSQRTPGLQTVVPTPNFPTYTSGHSTISGTAAEVMAGLFPDKAAFYRSEAEEAAMSRFWAGIHFPHDNHEGLAVGRRVGARAVARLRADEASRGPVLAARD